MRKNHPNRTSRGTVLIATLVCLLIVTGILGTMLHNGLRARRQLHVERDRRQAELLLQSGADRAAFRLAREADYRGETWKLPADAIVGNGAAAVTIEAARDTAKDAWKVHIVAEYPLGSERAIRRSQTFLFQP